MSSKKIPAKEAAQHRERGEIWISHAVISEADLEWLKETEWLVLWNVDIPPGFLARLPNLWFVDFRGGSSKDLEVFRGADQLRGIEILKVRGLSDVSLLSDLHRLEYLSIYGQAKILELPQLDRLAQLKHLSLGQMTGVTSMAGAFEAPNLEELLFSSKVNISSQDLALIQNHPTLKSFGWNAIDVPFRTYDSVISAINLPKISRIFPGEWFRNKANPK